MAPTIHRGKHGGVDLCDSCLPIVFDDSGKDFHESLSEDEAKPTLRHIKEDTGEMIMLQGFRLRQDSLPNLAGLLESSLSGCRLCGFIRLHILERDIGYEGEVYMNAGYTWGVDRDIFGSSTTNEGLVFWRCEVYKAPDSASVASISFNIESDDDKIVNWLRTDSKRAPQLLNEENVDWITSELRRCRNECGHIKDDTGFLPTRLIDVGDSDVDEPRLVISETLQRRFADDCPKLEYATLSYCWGPKEDAEQQVKTTRESLGMHLSRLPLASMSPVVRDTVRVCRALRIKYLWVDALCIVQGDAEDWNRESLTMGRVYYCATLTICPLASTSCLQGYLEPRSQGLTVEFQSSKRKDVNGTYTLFRSSDDRQAFWNQSSLLIDLSSSLWETRGWTFQENFLSGRTLFVGPSMWHFACENGGISENGYLYHGSVVHGSLRPLVDMARQPLPEDPDEASRTIRNAYARWDEIMQIQRRSWSYREDLLPGIAGLAEECAMITGDAYLAGLWKMDLHHELVWEVIKPEAGTLESAVRQKLDPRPYVAPSWSWASQTRPFELLPTRRYFPDAPRLPEEHEAKKTQKLVSLVDSMPCHVRPEFSVAATSMDLQWRSPFGRLNQGSRISLRGRIADFPSEVVMKPQDSNHPSFGYFVDGSGICLLDWSVEESTTQEPGRMRLMLLSSCCFQTNNWGKLQWLARMRDGEEASFDFPKPMGVLDPEDWKPPEDCAFCQGKSPRTIWGLVLHPAAQDGAWLRVGIFVVFQDHPECGIFGSSNEREVTLV